MTFLRRSKHPDTPRKNPKMEIRMNTDMAEDLKMMSDPESWPNYPVLPLKNYKERQEGGFPKFAMLLHRGGQYVIIYAAIYSDRNTLGDAKQEVITPEKAIADGWMVD